MRDYDPSTGRYVESDPIGLYGGGFSTYANGGSDPLLHTDPVGLAWNMRGSKIDKPLQGLPDKLCDYWPALCIQRIRMCTEARCKYQDHCGNEWYLMINSWSGGDAPTPEEVTKETPNCVCTKWQFRGGE